MGVTIHRLLAWSLAAKTLPLSAGLEKGRPTLDMRVPQLTDEIQQ